MPRTRPRSSSGFEGAGEKLRARSETCRRLRSDVFGASAAPKGMLLAGGSACFAVISEPSSLVRGGFLLRENRASMPKQYDTLRRPAGSVCPKHTHTPICTCTRGFADPTEPLLLPLPPLCSALAA